MTTLQRQLQFTYPRTHSVLSTVALWDLFKTPASSAHRRLRVFVTLLCKALSQYLRPCASLKSTYIPVSSKQIRFIAVDRYVMPWCIYSVLCLGIYMFVSSVVQRMKVYGHIVGVNDSRNMTCRLLNLYANAP